MEIKIKANERNKYFDETIKIGTNVPSLKIFISSFFHRI